MAFGSLWGLIACHGYGNHGLRVSFPVRQMLRLLSDSVSRNIERLSYAARLHTRKLVRSTWQDSYTARAHTHIASFSFAATDQHHSNRRSSYRVYRFERQRPPDSV
jgi:light-regulated signal transduction histidine kinase (bacteriophytochrome)